MQPEPVDVWVIDGHPARFIWRGRLFTVLSVIERPPPKADPSAAERAKSEPPLPAKSRWRVTASTARNVPPATYWLWLDESTGRWLISRNGENEE